MKNKQFYTYKFNSARLKEFNYKVDLTFKDALDYGEVIALFDNQVLRSIRDIKNRHINDEYLDQLYKEKSKLHRELHSPETSLKLQEIQNEINTALFIPEYITIVMDHPSHYKYLFENGLFLNGQKYIRFNSSAGQARVSTVTFCDESIISKL